MAKVSRMDTLSELRQERPFLSKVRSTSTVSSASRCTSASSVSFDSVSQVSDQAVHSTAARYNALANKHVLPQLDQIESEPKIAPVAYDSGPRRFGFMKRSQTTVDLAKIAAGNTTPTENKGSTKTTRSRSRWSLGKSQSVTDVQLLMRQGKYSIIGQPLDEVVRQGGQMEFVLPPMLTPFCLRLPTIAYSCASYIALHGTKTPGIFRLSGSIPILNELANHFTGIMVAQKDTPSQQPQPQFPNINFNVHDVACLLKRFIAGLPGGLIGSTQIFKSLLSLCGKEHEDRPEMIAILLRMIDTQARLHLLCAVMGLCKMVATASMQIVASKDVDAKDKVALMKVDSLSIIFGPLLLGHSSSTEVSNRMSVPSRDQMQDELRKARKASLVVQLLLAEWEQIVIELRRGQQMHYPLSTKITYDKKPESALQEVASNRSNGASPRLQSIPIFTDEKENALPVGRQSDNFRPSGITNDTSLPKLKSEFNLFSRLRGNRSHPVDSKRASIDLTFRKPSGDQSEVQRLKLEIAERNEHFYRLTRQHESLQAQLTQQSELMKLLTETQLDLEKWKARAEVAEEQVRQMEA